jgi:hypothetical protein
MISVCETSTAEATRSRSTAAKTSPAATARPGNACCLVSAPFTIKPVAHHCLYKIAHTAWSGPSIMKDIHVVVIQKVMVDELK